MTAPLIWTSGSSPGSRTMPRGSSSAANIMRPAKWTWSNFGDEPKPAPEFFRERHSKTRPIVCLETGESFMGNPAAARPLHVSPAAISQAVRYGSPVNGLHFYHGDEPKPAPEFFKPAKGKGGKSPAAIAAAAKAAAGNSAPGTDYREHGIQRDRRAVQ